MTQTISQAAESFLNELQNFKTEYITDYNARSQTFIYHRTISGFVNGIYLDISFIEHEHGTAIRFSPQSDNEAFFRKILNKAVPGNKAFVRTQYQIAV